MVNNEFGKVWKIWFDFEVFEDIFILDGYEGFFDIFRKLLFIRVWCLDCIIN